MALRPTFSRGLPLSSDGAAGAPGAEEGKRHAREQLPVMAAPEMRLRGSVYGVRRRVGLTYLAEKSVPVSLFLTLRRGKLLHCRPDGKDVAMTGLVILVTVGLMVGDDTGQTTVVAKFGSALSRRNNKRWPSHVKIAA